jgi:NAD(P)-dependent dehydrogenase (short-subunit alcohol dehydrogenase family)
MGNRFVSEVPLKGSKIVQFALGERTEPEEVADAAFFLASPAGARITGELISVSGYMGWDA